MPCPNCGNTRLSRKSRIMNLVDGYWWCNACKHVVHIDIRDTMHMELCSKCGTIQKEKGPCGLCGAGGLRARRLLRGQSPPGGITANMVEGWS